MNSPSQTGGQINISFDEESNTNCSQFNCGQHAINITFSNSATTFNDAQTEIEQLFTNLHTMLLDKMNDRDKIRLVFFHDSFLEGPIRLPFISKKDFVKTNLIDNFNHVIQSYRIANCNIDCMLFTIKLRTIGI